MRVTSLLALVPLLTTGHASTNFALSTANCQLPTANCQLPTPHGDLNRYASCFFEYLDKPSRVIAS
jgi:hypothetical protein